MQEKGMFFFTYITNHLSHNIILQASNKKGDVFSTPPYLLSIHISLEIYSRATAHAATAANVTSQIEQTEFHTVVTSTHRIAIASLLGLIPASTAF